MIYLLIKKGCCKRVLPIDTSRLEDRMVFKKLIADDDLLTFYEQQQDIFAINFYYCCDGMEFRIFATQEEAEAS